MIDLVDALNHLLVAPLVALDIEVVPDHQLPVQIRVEDLFLERLSHVQKLRNKGYLVYILVFINHGEYFSSFIFYGLPQHRPILIVMLFRPLGLLDVEGHHLLSDPNEVLNVLLKSVDDHGEVVLSDLAPPVFS